MLKRRMDTAVRHPKVYLNNSKLIMFVNSKTYKLKSFTLIELLVVISVIGLLSSIVLVSTKGIREKARIAKTLEFSQSLQNALGSEAVGVWSFDECAAQGAAPPGGAAKDSSGYGNNGTVSGALCDQETPQSIIGQGSGKWALSFDGVNDYVDAGSGSAIDDLAVFTYSLWIKQNTQGSLQKLWDKNWKRTRINANGTLQIDITAATVAASTVTTNTVTPDVWTHIVVTYNDSGDRKARFYINGVEASYSTQTPASGSLSSEAANILKIGADSLYFFNGLIDEVRIYGKALTLGEIQQHYAEGLKNHQNLTMK